MIGWGDEETPSPDRGDQERHPAGAWWPATTTDGESAPAPPPLPAGDESRTAADEDVALDSLAEPEESAPPVTPDPFSEPEESEPTTALDPLAEREEGDRPDAPPAEPSAGGGADDPATVGGRAPDATPEPAPAATFPLSTTVPGQEGRATAEAAESAPVAELNGPERVLPVEALESLDALRRRIADWSASTQDAAENDGDRPTAATPGPLPEADVPVPAAAMPGPQAEAEVPVPEEGGLPSSPDDAAPDTGGDDVPAPDAAEPTGGDSIYRFPVTIPVAVADHRRGGTDLALDEVTVPATEPAPPDEVPEPGGPPGDSPRRGGLRVVPPLAAEAQPERPGLPPDVTAARRARAAVTLVVVVVLAGVTIAAALAVALAVLSLALRRAVGG